MPASSCTPMIHLHGGFHFVWSDLGFQLRVGVRRLKSGFIHVLEHKFGLNFCCGSCVHRDKQLLAVILWFLQKLDGIKRLLHENMTLRTVTLCCVVYFSTQIFIPKLKTCIKTGGWKHTLCSSDISTLLLPLRDLTGRDKLHLHLLYYFK